MNKEKSVSALIKKTKTFLRLDPGRQNAFRGMKKRAIPRSIKKFVTSFDNSPSGLLNHSLKGSITVRKINTFSSSKPQIPASIKPLNLPSSPSPSSVLRKSYLPKHLIYIKEATSMDTPKIQSSKTFRSKTLKKIRIKEVQNNTDWTEKAKFELENFWKMTINNSNGLEIIPDISPNFKYYIGKGNNSRLIRKIFAKRPWWTEVSDLETANFIWTQWKEKQVFSSLSCWDPIKRTVKNIENWNCTCSQAIKSGPGQYNTVNIEELGYQLIRNSESYVSVNTSTFAPNILKIYNKIEFNQHLTNKKGMYRSMKRLCEKLGKDVFEFVPITFHVKHQDDEEFAKFKEYFSEQNKELSSNNVWILKPGENSNRGQGISLFNSLTTLASLLQKQKSQKKNTFILQKYIENPFLIHRRKFDFRCYGLITSINGILQGYFYADGYLKTASCEYNLKDTSNNFIHLTNDAIQKHSTDYGKFEDNNKLSYREFQRYLENYCSEKTLNFDSDILPQMKKLMKTSMQSVFLNIDFKKRLNCMEIFGYDFMLDANGKLWLIEVNTNPCLELSSRYLSLIIPAMIENAIRIAVDPIFPAPLNRPIQAFSKNLFELIFHQESDGKSLIL